MELEAFMQFWWLILFAFVVTGFAVLRALLAYRYVCIRRHDVAREAKELRIQYLIDRQRRLRNLGPDDTGDESDFEIVG